MALKTTLSATIVLYNEDEQILQKTIESFLNIPMQKKLFLIDNSNTDVLKKHANHPDIEYQFNSKNIGFGKAHNLVIPEIRDNSTFHLILNPDVFFNSEVIPNLVKELQKDKNLAMTVPKVIYPDQSIQYICRKFPTFFDLIIRRLGILKKRIKEQEYQNIDLSKPFNPEAVHGCFMLFNTNDFVAINGFDERYFLYLEDIDICKKINNHKKKILYFPSEEITHIHQKGSAKNIKLLFYHLSSAIKYFVKW